MGLSLLFSTILSVVIFLPVSIFFKKSDSRSPLSMIFYGGATWSLVALFQLIILQILNALTQFDIAQGLSATSMVQVLGDAKAILFWYLFFMTLIGQILLYQGTEFISMGDHVMNYVYFGIGWGLSEYIQRFLFSDFNIAYKSFFFLYAVLISTGISSTIIRTAENSKFIMFDTFMKFFGEMAIFGGIGSGNSQSKFITDAGSVVFFILVMTSLSMITRKYPLKEDAPKTVAS